MGDLIVAGETLAIPVEGVEHVEVSWASYNTMHALTVTLDVNRVDGIH